MVVTEVVPRVLLEVLSVRRLAARRSNCKDFKDVPRRRDVGGAFVFVSYFFYPFSSFFPQHVQANEWRVMSQTILDTLYQASLP